MKNLSILGSTGSIGQSALAVARHLPESLKVRALAAKSNIDLLEKQAREFHPELIAVEDPHKAFELKKRLPHLKVVAGLEGMKEAATLSSVDVVLSSMVGCAGIIPTAEAIKAGKLIALANKEVLVTAGEYITSLAKAHHVKLIPVDSEHSALFQCLSGNSIKSLRKMVLTASGGPFLHYSLKELQEVTVEKALKHPNWKMGPKVTIDSSTLMNKGLEVVEAHFLFGIPVEQIEVVVHPESFVHSFIEYVDGSIMAQMASPDMVLPIQYALTYPERMPGLLKPFDFTKQWSLHFSPPDLSRFPCLGLVYEALRVKGSMLPFLNGVNEVLVNKFLNNQISWKQIPEKLEKLMSLHSLTQSLTLEEILDVDKGARLEAEKI